MWFFTGVDEAEKGMDVCMHEGVSSKKPLIYCKICLFDHIPSVIGVIHLLLLLIIIFLFYFIILFFCNSNQKRGS